MALSNTTKTAIANLCTLISNDPGLCSQLKSSAERLLQGSAATSVTAILARDANSMTISAAATALAALAADVAAN